MSGLTLSRPLKIDYKPVTRVENFCATGSEAFRNACYAVASGAYDVAMAIGVEKLKDSGYSGLVGIGAAGRRHRGDAHRAGDVQPARAGLRQEVRRRRGRDEGRAHPHRVEEPQATARSTRGPSSARRCRRRRIACSPLVAGPLGIFDCSGVSDGSAAAIIVRAEDAHNYTDNPLYVKALSFVAGPAAGPIDPDYDYTTFPEVVRSAADAYAPGRHHRPARRAGHGRGARLLHARPSWC